VVLPWLVNHKQHSAYQLLLIDPHHFNQLTRAEQQVLIRTQYLKLARRYHPAANMLFEKQLTPMFLALTHAKEYLENLYYQLDTTDYVNNLFTRLANQARDLDEIAFDKLIDFIIVDHEPSIERERNITRNFLELKSNSKKLFIFPPELEKKSFLDIIRIINEKNVDSYFACIKQKMNDPTSPLPFKMIEKFLIHLMFIKSNIGLHAFKLLTENVQNNDELEYCFEYYSNNSNPTASPIHSFIMHFVLMKAYNVSNFNQALAHFQCIDSQLGLIGKLIKTLETFCLDTINFKFKQNTHEFFIDQVNEFIRCFIANIDLPIFPIVETNMASYIKLNHLNIQQELVPLENVLAKQRQLMVNDEDRQTLDRYCIIIYNSLCNLGFHSQSFAPYCLPNWNATYQQLIETIEPYINHEDLLSVSSIPTKLKQSLTVIQSSNWNDSLKKQKALEQVIDYYHLLRSTETYTMLPYSFSSLFVKRHPLAEKLMPILEKYFLAYSYEPTRQRLSYSQHFVRKLTINPFAELILQHHYNLPCKYPAHYAAYVNKKFR